MRARYLAWRKKRVNRRTEKTIAKSQKALDRLHGHYAQPMRNPRRFRQHGRGSSDWGATVEDFFGALIEMLFKIFD